jgi:hypothetical protein
VKLTAVNVFILNGGGIPWSFVFSLVLLAAGIGLLLYVLLTNKQKEGKLFGSLEGDSCAITQFIGDKKDEKPKFDKINMMCKLRPELFEQETNDKTENGEINEKEDTI